MHSFPWEKHNPRKHQNIRYNDRILSNSNNYVQRAQNSKICMKLWLKLLILIWNTPFSPSEILPLTAAHLKTEKRQWNIGGNRTDGREGMEREGEDRKREFRKSKAIGSYRWSKWSEQCTMLRGRIIPVNQLLQTENQTNETGKQEYNRWVGYCPPINRYDDVYNIAQYIVTWEFFFCSQLSDNDDWLSFLS